jgi:hypothetical protein
MLSCERPARGRCLLGGGAEASVKEGGAKLERRGAGATRRHAACVACVHVSRVPTQRTQLKCSAVNLQARKMHNSLLV